MKKTYEELETEEAIYRAVSAVLSDEFKLGGFRFKFGDPDSLDALGYLDKYKRLQNSKAKTKSGLVTRKKKMAELKERINFFLHRLEKK